MLERFKRSVEVNMIALILLGTLFVLAGSMLVMYSVRQNNIEIVGKNTAQTMADQLFSLRTFYSNQVVPRARTGGLALDHTWDSSDNVLPVPASLIKAVGADFQERHEGTLIRTYSRYPWPHRAATESYDAFELAAIESLERDPATPYFEVIEYQDQTAIRYAVADVMGESCVACHNSHAESPKTDWAVGDVRGVLEIIVPVEAAKSGVTTGMGILAAIVTVGLGLLAAGIWWFLKRRVFRPIDNIVHTAESIDAGDLTVRANVYSDDEFGFMAQKFNEMLDNTTQLLSASQEENSRMQTEINTLLREVSTVATGDLTVRVTPAEGITGQIGSSFDYMISQLRNIITDVHSTSLQVSASTEQIQSTASSLAAASEMQAEQIINTSAAIDEMSVSIQQVSENSTLSATVGEQARANAKKGADAVDNTISGMGRIREQVALSSDNLQRLSDSSAEIGSILKTIGDISERTSILALNAAIQASVAGEAGSGFAVVAEEVELLAERSAEATKQIDQIVRNIQSETSEAITNMNAAVVEVDAGSELANEAGEALDEIGAVSDRLSELIQQISLASQQQARGSETLARAMNEISQFTQENASGTQQASASIRELASLADGLRSSVSSFKLDEQPITGHKDGTLVSLPDAL